MTIYAVIYSYADDSDSSRDEHRAAHRAFLAELDNPVGPVVLLATGPFTDTAGALLIISAPTRAAVEQTLDADPFATVGVIRDRVVREWTQVRGPWA